MWNLSETIAHFSHELCVLTFACCEDGCVDKQQQGVVEETLQHGCLHAGIGQVLAAHSRPTDQQGQDLAHDHGLHQTPGRRQNKAYM